jgi:hypothetical protein
VIDGDGVAGSALVTNVGILNWGRTATNSTLLLTGGGQMNINGEIRIGNPYYSENGGASLTIQGGTATSTLTGSTSQDFYIGYGERTGSKNNVVNIAAGGVLTNIRDMFVGHINNAQNNDNPTTNNQLLVTGGTASMRGLTLGYIQTNTKDATANVVAVTIGGDLTTTGTGYVGRANASDSTSNANTLTVTGTGSSWDAGNQTVYVGHTNNATAASNNNILTVANGGELTNVGSLIVGFGSGTETGNQVVLDGGNISATTVTVNAGNSLAGSGTITGVVTVNGTLTPGNSTGTLAVTGDLNISGLAGGTGGLSFELGPISSSDKITVSGDLNIGTLNFADFVFADAGGMQDGTYVLISGATSLTGDLDTTPGSLSGAIVPGVTGTLQRSGGGTGNDIELVVSGVGGGSSYADWQTANGTSQTIDQDHDNDGVANGIEFFIYGPNAASGFTALPSVDNTGGVLSVTWTKHSDYTGTYGEAPTGDFVVETSDTLSGWSAASTSLTPNMPGTVYIDAVNHKVTYTFPNPLDTKKFARLKVTGP